MPISADTLRLLMDAGMTGEELLAVVESIDADHSRLPVDSELERRRAKDRERKRLARMSTDNSTETSTDNDEPQKGLSPQTPLSKNSLPPVSPKGKTYPQAEFDEFWAAYPNKTAKPAAVKAFPKALKRAALPEIMAGLERYANKTDDAPWCHPATWLNNDRWADEPAPPPIQRKGTGPPQGVSELDRALFGESSPPIEVLAND